MALLSGSHMMVISRPRDPSFRGDEAANCCAIQGNFWENLAICNMAGCLDIIWNGYYKWSVWLTVASFVHPGNHGNVHICRTWESTWSGQHKHWSNKLKKRQFSMELLWGIFSCLSILNIWCTNSSKSEVYNLLPVNFTSTWYRWLACHV